jgi:succinate dehydrogenase/fumarate reductase flavoprotein subunit
MPGWLIFDERARLAGPLNGIVGTPNDYVWSADNSAELAAGWIKPVEEIEARHLQATLAEYGTEPDEFGRRSIVPLEPPLYAIEMHPAVATASGGPRRDAQARVLRPDGTPIPGLFAAGAAGSIWGHLTEHGGGLTDAIVFGRIAGLTASS